MMHNFLFLEISFKTEKTSTSAMKESYEIVTDMLIILSHYLKQYKSSSTAIDW